MKDVMHKKTGKKESNGSTFVALTPGGLAWRNPFNELESIQNRLNRLLSVSTPGWSQRETPFTPRAWSPALDIIDSKDSIHVRADVPGMSKNDLELSVDGNILLIKGEKTQESRTKEKNFYKCERIFGSFNRAVSLPAVVDAAKGTAKYKDGVLELVLPKKTGAKQKRVNINIK